MPVLVSELAMHFGERILFRDITETFREGESVALMGPSGTGKSTLLGVLSGTITPTAGTVHYRPSALVVDWMFQSTPLLAHRTALHNVALGGLSRGLTMEQASLEATQVLESLGLGEQWKAPVFRMSGGERQRVAVGRSLMRQAEVVLADEPTASLDSATRSVVCEALRRAAAAGASVVIATHDPWVAERCDRTIVLGA